LGLGWRGGASVAINTGRPPPCSACLGRAGVGYVWGNDLGASVRVHGSVAVGRDRRPGGDRVPGGRVVWRWGVGAAGPMKTGSSRQEWAACPQITAPPVGLTSSQRPSRANHPTTQPTAQPPNRSPVDQLLVDLGLGHGLEVAAQLLEHLGRDGRRQPAGWEYRRYVLGMCTGRLHIKKMQPHHLAPNNKHRSHRLLTQHSCSPLEVVGGTTRATTA
jgi:hypothetical protein